MRERAEGRQRLWQDYLSTRDPDIRTQLIMGSAGLLKWAVGRVALDLPPEITKESLLDYAIQELLRVIDGPASMQPVQFDAYLASRVRKAILDGLRRSLGSGAAIYRVVGPLIYRCATCFRSKGVLPAAGELLGRDDSKQAEQERLLAGASLAALLITPDLVPADTGNAVENETVQACLAAAISRLPQSEQIVLALYHIEELTISEISRVLKISRRTVAARFALASVYVLGQMSRSVVAVSSDRMRAEVTVYPWLDGPGKGEFPGADAIGASLSEAGVTDGIDYDAITDLAQSPAEGKTNLVAKGTPPVNGQDGRLETVFEFDKEGREAWPGRWVKGRVAPDQVLLVGVPPERGKPGRDVTGCDVPAADGRPAKLSVGANCTLVSEGTQIRSSIDGQAWFDGEFVEVVPVLELDEALEGRHYRFPGTIVVRGSIRSGSRVFAEWDISAGRIEGAEVAAGGDVTVAGGISGCDGGGIKAAGNVRSRFIEASSVKAGGSVRVAEHVVHSSVEACSSIRTGTWVCGGQIVSGSNVTLGVAGGELGTRTVVAAGDHRVLHEGMVALGRILGGEPEARGLLLGRVARAMMEALEAQASPAAERGCQIRAAMGLRAGVTLSVAGVTRFVDDDLGAGYTVFEKDGTLGWRSFNAVRQSS